ncbi:hypothetical protein [Yoonia sp. MH D7]
MNGTPQYDLIVSCDGSNYVVSGHCDDTLLLCLESDDAMTYDTGSFG